MRAWLYTAAALHRDNRCVNCFHYHHSVVQGALLGQHVAHHVLANFFQPVAKH